MEWRLRVMLSLLAALMVFIVGLALTMIGIGLPLVAVSPFLAVLLLFLPWKRCRRCGYITVRRMRPAKD